MASLDSNTPFITAVDPRGLVVRAIRYNRRQESLPAEICLSRSGYDRIGRRVAEWSPGRSGIDDRPQLTLTYSLFGAVLRRHNADKGAGTSLYAATGVAVLMWDERRTVTSITYDSQSRPVAWHEQMLDEDSGRCLERRRYSGPEGADSNHCGRIRRHEDPAGVLEWTERSIDDQPRVETRRFLSTLTPPDWPEAESDGDALLEDEEYVTRWTYDAVGSPILQVDAAGHRRANSFGMGGNLSAVRLTWANGGEHLLLDGLEYDAQGRITAQKAGNGVITSTTFDPASGRLLDFVTKRADGHVVQAMSYGYDPAGNVASINDTTLPVRYWRNRRSGGMNSFRYDTLYQLVEATGQESAGAGILPTLPPYQPIGDDTVLTPYIQAYTYDANGNLACMQHTGTNSYTNEIRVAPHSNRAIPWTPGDPDPDFEGAFDGSGNPKRLQPGGSTLCWNGRNQLRRVVSVSRTAAPDDDEVYVYDGSGKRLRKVCTRLTENTAQISETRYLPGLQLRTSSHRSEILEVVSATMGRITITGLHWKAGRPQGIEDLQLRYTFADHLGSAVVELDGDAALISAEHYYPYGSTAWRSARSAIEADYRTVRYSGEERDGTGLYYYGSRYYVPWLGRWLNPDPAGEIDGLNLFAMVGNSPIRYADETGMQMTPIQLLRQNYSTNVKPFIVERAEADRDRATGRLVEEWGVSEPEATRHLESIVSAVRGAPFSINVNATRLLQFSGSHIQNAFESGTRRTESYLARRQIRDELLVRIDTAGESFRKVFALNTPSGETNIDFDPRSHPIHGAIQLHSPSTREGAVPESMRRDYGLSALFIDDNVVNYMTFTPDDSMNLYWESGADSGDAGMAEFQSRLANFANPYPLVRYATPDQLKHYRMLAEGSPVDRPLNPYVEWQAHTEIPLTGGIKTIAVHPAEASSAPKRWFGQSFHTRMTNFAKKHGSELVWL
ncbi:RHS repeat-associated core domain-containing protein [Luteibacter sp. SG786]|uniref:RHS repeat-associated core domain-containing protein n=1 Tax=Luteibacter sp. SG786 TaxID=2587130 RepID=UPI0014226DFF|nr:RHS repeat-associated core domain-containing protein [Luteibacter sp. SG786]NII55303.1 insecticidal toxin complex protein TccC [Luteibacter sp. SG786]